MGVRISSALRGAKGTENIACGMRAHKRSQRGACAVLPAGEFRPPAQFALLALRPRLRIDNQEGRAPIPTPLGFDEPRVAGREQRHEAATSEVHLSARRSAAVGRPAQDTAIAGGAPWLRSSTAEAKGCAFVERCAIGTRGRVRTARQGWGRRAPPPTSRHGQQPRCRRAWLGQNHPRPHPAPSDRGPHMGLQGMPPGRTARTGGPCGRRQRTGRRDSAGGSEAARWAAAITCCCFLAQALSQDRTHDMQLGP